MRVWQMIGFFVVSGICLFYIVGALLEIKWIVRPNPTHWMFNPLAGISRLVTEKQMKWIVITSYMAGLLFLIVIALI